MNNRPKPVTRVDRKDMGGDPIMVIEGLDVVIEMDLNKHKAILERTILELQAYSKGVAHAVKHKKHYKSLIGGGKYNDEALEKSITQININIRHLSDKVKLSKDKIDHEKLIVDTLTQQLKDHHKGLKILAEHRKRELDALNNRLVQSTN